MKRLKTIFACMLMALFSIGQVWADNVVYTFNTDAGLTALGISKASENNGTSLGNETYTLSPVSLSATHASNPTRVWTATGGATDLRIYKNGGSLTFSVSGNYKLTSIVMAGSAVGNFSVDNGSTGTFTSGTWTAANNTAPKSVKLNATNTGKINTITVNYASTETSTPTLTCATTSLSFEAEAGSTDQKQFTFSGANLTANAGLAITGDNAGLFSVQPTSVSKGTGTISDSQVTVTYSPTAAGNHSATLTISSTGATSKTIALTGTATAPTVKHKAFFYNGETLLNAGGTEFAEGAAVSYSGATPVSCETGTGKSGTFVGWAKETWTGKKATKAEIEVDFYEGALPNMGTGDEDYSETYYAVFAKVSGTSGWNLTDIADLTSSDVFVLADASNYALNNDGGTSNAPSTNAITVSDGKITSEVADNLKWNISGNATDGYTFYPNGDSETWLYCNTTASSSSNNNMRVGTGDRKVFEIDDDGYLVTKDTYTARYLSIYNNADFRGYVNTNTNPVQPKCYKYSAGSASDYMTTCAACTHLVDAPELDGTIAVTHNTATINWKTLTNASSYDVTVIRNSDSESIFSGNVNALTKALTGLDPETQYDYSIMGVGDGSTYCTTGNGVLNGSFTTDAVPTAKLYLVQLKGEDPVDGGTHALGVEFDLPTSAATCGKTLVGWTTETYENYTHATTAPTVLLKKYTFASTDDVTLYAVYANVEEDDETITPSAVAEGDDPHAITINKSGYTLSANKNAGSTAPAWNSGASDVRIYAAGDITLASTSTMTRIVFNLSTQGKKRLAPITASVGTIATQAANDETVTWTGSATSVTFTVGAAADYGSDGSTKAGQLCFSNIDVTVQGEFSNYSTTCVDAPVATPSPAALNDVAVAGASGTITMTYEHVNASGVAVSLWNNAACTEAFEGSWLTASLDGDKNITYTIAENTSYNDARSAYIKLIAPETFGAASPAVVKIPVSQAKKAAVFSSLEELVAADVNANTNVTVSFSNIMITEVYETNAGYRYGLYLNVKDKDGENDIELFYNKQGNSEQVPDTWVKNGYVSATNLVGTWTLFSGTWELAMQGATWSWENGDITYAAPKAVSSVVVSGAPTKTAYVDGEQFNPAGLTVTVNYTVGDPEVIDAAAADWAFTPAKLAIGNTSVEVVATYNSVSSEAFEVTGLTVGEIPNKTVAEFIAAEGTRCYLEGVVSNITNTKYGNFYLTDASGTIYVFGCLNQAGESQKFADLDVSADDKIKVIAEQYLDHATSGHEAVNVQFVSKVSAATIDIDDIDMVVGDELLLTAIEATITPVAAQSADINYTVTEGTAVTISEGKIIASTEGEATITASIEAGEGYLAGSTTFTVTVSPAPEPFEGDYFVKVDDNSKLTAGEYLIVYEDGSLAFNGGLETLDAVGNTVAVTFDHGKIQGTDPVLAATFTIKLAGTIQSHSGYYIGQNSNANGLASSTEIQYNSAISIDASKNAVIESEGGAYLRYNSTSGQTRFRYFKSATYDQQQPIALYKKENAAPVYETVRTDLNAGEYYTMCLDKAVTAVKGASIWRVVSKSDNTSNPGIILEDVELPLQAGRPYIFNATADKLEVVYNGAAVSTPVEEGNNGLVGSFSKASITADDNNYIIYNNELYYVNSGNVYVGANRAYLHMGDDVPEYQPTSGNVQGRRRVVMNVNNGNQMPTGIEGIEVSEAPRKVMIDGQLFILRDKKMYDASGRLVK